jgi:pyruvate dehydrogenase E2 component (dihydrolipoamide acetyltransferase)
MSLSAPRAAAVHDLVLADGRRIRARSWPGRGRPLVLLHGLLDDSEGWSRLARDTHRPCLAVDLPGFGGSDLPAWPRVSAYAEVVSAALAGLALGPCTLVGHSLGGAVAAGVAERHPDVAALVLLAPAGFGPLRLAEVMAAPGIRHAAQLALPMALVNPLTVTAAYSTLIARGRLPPADLLERLARRGLCSGAGVVMAVQALAAAGRSERAFFRRELAFAGPVAALWGARDALVGADHADGLRRSVPRAHVEIWPGMGHHSERERPRELSRFVERHAARARRRTRRGAAPRGLRRAAPAERHAQAA